MRVRTLLSLSLLMVWLSSPGRAAGQATPPDRKDVDGQLHTGLRDVINQGADLYNGGDPAACYYLFHGALVATSPLLSHRPEVQKIIQDGLSNARLLPRFNQRAHALRGVLDRVRKIIAPESKAAEEGKKGEKKPGEKPGT